MAKKAWIRDRKAFNRLCDGALAEVFDEMVGDAQAALGISEHVISFESPIEELLYVGMQVMGRVRGYTTIDSWEVDAYKRSKYYVGRDTLYIEPQKKILDYRVDFWLEFYSDLYDGETGMCAAIVECDGRDFHHGNEKCAIADKARDRKLASQARFIFRYPGTEIFNDPYETASELVGELQSEAHSNAKINADKRSA